MQDLTLQTFLLQELDCKPLDALDVPMVLFETLGNKFNSGEFEHMRLNLEQGTPMTIIQDLVEKYYGELGYVLAELESGTNFEPAFVFCLSIDEKPHSLVVAIMENKDILNITVSAVIFE